MSLTARERKVLRLTRELVVAFADLEHAEGESHPSHALDLGNAIHAIQRIVAVRVARRVDAEEWGVAPIPRELQAGGQPASDDSSPSVAAPSDDSPPAGHGSSAAGQGVPDPRPEPALPSDGEEGVQ